MKVLQITTAIFSVLIVIISQPAFAVPTFQAYIEGATAGNYGGDQQTWFTTDSSFNLIVVGAYGPKTVVPLSEVTLLISVPQGETGTISISDGDGGALLLTDITEVPGTIYYNPNADADIDLLTNEAGFDGYMTKNFLPDDQTLDNNHYPLKNEVSNFLIYGIGDFDKLGDVHNYNADDGSITLAGQGEEKTFGVEITGFSWVHFDVYGFETIDSQKEFRSTWDISPGSHDATYIPAPGALFLGGIGVVLVGWLKRRRTL